MPEPRPGRKRNFPFPPRNPRPDQLVGEYVAEPHPLPGNDGRRVLLTDYEWHQGIVPDDATLARREREVGEGTAQGPAMPGLDVRAPAGFEKRMAEAATGRMAQVVELRAAAPLRGRKAQESTADLDLFGQRTLL